MITFVLLGSDITRVPSIGKVLYMEKSRPTARDLYAKRVEGAMAVETEYFSLLDGGEDLLFDNFEDGINAVCEKLTDTGLDIGSAKALAPFYPNGRYMHHGVVCRTSAFKSLNLPPVGHFHFETMVYRRLKEKGTVEHDAIIYNWIPSVNGANSWQDSNLARSNSFGWVLRRPLLNISEDGMSILDK